MNTDRFDISRVSPSLLADALVRIEEVNTKPSDDQVNSLLTKIAFAEHIEIRRLTLDSSHKLWIETNVSGSPPEVISQAVVRLERISLFNTGLTPHQLNTIFTKIANSKNLSLKVLSLSFNNISSVPPDLLVNAISKLQAGFKSLQDSIDILTIKIIVMSTGLNLIG